MVNNKKNSQEVVSKDENKSNLNSEKNALRKEIDVLEDGTSDREIFEEKLKIPSWFVVLLKLS